MSARHHIYINKNMLISEIDRRGFLTGLGAAAASTLVPAIAQASEPLVSSQDPRAVEQALQNLAVEKQRLLRMQQILKNPTPEMRSWSPARFQNTVDRVEQDLKINATMTRRGQEQLTRLTGRPSTSGPDRVERTAQSRPINRPSDF